MTEQSWSRASLPIARSLADTWFIGYPTVDPRNATGTWPFGSFPELVKDFPWVLEDPTPVVCGAWHFDAPTGFEPPSSVVGRAPKPLDTHPAADKVFSALEELDVGWMILPNEDVIRVFAILPGRTLNTDEDSLSFPSQVHSIRIELFDSVSGPKIEVSSPVLVSTTHTADSLLAPTGAFLRFVVLPAWVKTAVFLGETPFPSLKTPMNFPRTLSFEGVPADRLPIPYFTGDPVHSKEVVVPHFESDDDFESGDASLTSLTAASFTSLYTFGEVIDADLPPDALKQCLMTCIGAATAVPAMFQDAYDLEVLKDDLVPPKPIPYSHLLLSASEDPNDLPFVPFNVGAHDTSDQRLIDVSAARRSPRDPANTELPWCSFVSAGHMSSLLRGDEDSSPEPTASTTKTEDPVIDSSSSQLPNKSFGQDPSPPSKLHKESMWSPTSKKIISNTNDSPSQIPNSASAACPACGAQTRQGDSFCMACGADLGQCPSCGVELMGEAPKFCGSCGHQLSLSPTGESLNVNSVNQRTLSTIGIPAEALHDADPDLVRRADEGDALAANDLGLFLETSGFTTEGMKLFRLSSLAGIPWAMANFSWRALLHGNPQDAIDLYNEAAQPLQEFANSDFIDAASAEAVTFQLANARSNVAACMFAVGDDPRQALAWWDAGAELGHTESIFYPLIADFRQRRTENSKELWEQFSNPTQQLDDETIRLPSPSVAARQRSWGLTHEQVGRLTQDLLEGMNCSNPWFVEWCRDGDRLLRGPEEGPDWDRVDRAMGEDSLARESARTEIISSIDHLTMEACAARAHASGEAADCEFWWLEIATAPACDEVIARGVDGLCTLVLIPQRRMYEARLYYMHLISRANPDAQSVGAEGLDQLPVTHGLYHDAVDADEGYDVLMRHLDDKTKASDTAGLMENNYEFLMMATGWLIGFSDSVASDPSRESEAPLHREIGARALTDWLTAQQSTNLSSAAVPDDRLPEADLHRLADAGVAEAVKDVGIRRYREGDHQKAADWWRKASTMWHGGAMRNLGKLAEEDGDHVTARDWYDQAWAVGLPTAGMHIAINLFLRGDEAAAQNQLNSISANNAAGAAVEIARLLHGREELTKAVEWYERGVHLGSPTVVLILASVLMGMDRRDEALEWYRWAADRGIVAARKMLDFYDVTES